MRLIYKDENFKEYCSIATVSQLTQKLGQYEDIDESPEHLAKVKKALEIIKNKNVSVTGIKIADDLKTYNDWWTSKKEDRLTQEEYDLLKEVLCDE